MKLTHEDLENISSLYNNPLMVSLQKLQGELLSRMLSDVINFELSVGKAEGLAHARERYRGAKHILEMTSAEIAKLYKKVPEKD